MAEKPVQRRLAAVLAADVADYTRLIGEDEAGTRARYTHGITAATGRRKDMKMRLNMDFESLDLDAGFSDYDGNVPGISEKILSDDRDLDARTGKRTRLLRLDPGVQTPKAHAHDYWEEIYMFKGSMIEGTPETGEKRVTAPAYACREPGYTHGPIRTDEECLLIEFSWYPDKSHWAD